MNPNKCGIVENECKLPKILAVCHRGTQKNEDSPKDSKDLCDICKDVSTSPAGSSNEDSIKVFEFSQIVKDTKNPENITIIKDTFSEEIRDHSCDSPNASSNRYKYSREIVKPFIRDLKNCPGRFSDEEVISEVLKTVGKDFPDHKHCFSVASSGSCPSETKLDKSKNCSKKKGDEIPAVCCEKLSSSAQPSNASSGGSSFIPIKTCKAEEPKRKGSTESTASYNSCSGKSGDMSCESSCEFITKGRKIEKVVKKSSLAKKMTKEQEEDTYDEPYDPCKKPKCKRMCVCPEPIKSCVKPKVEPRLPPPVFCPEENTGPKCERKLFTGCEDEKELKEMAKRAKQACKSGSSLELPPAPKPPLQKSVMEAHCEAMETLKAVASCAMCKVYDVTKDTVSLIRTESAKQFEKIKSLNSECDNICDPKKDPKKECKKKKSRDSGVTEVTNIFGTKNILENLEQLHHKVDPDDVLHKVVEKVESTITVISEHVNLSSITAILKKEENPYDRPPSPPQDYDTLVRRLSRDDIHAADGPREFGQDISNTANNMFTALKSKIFSMFSDINKGVENPENVDDDDDDDD